LAAVRGGATAVAGAEEEEERERSGAEPAEEAMVMVADKRRVLRIAF
jgi:hypothetical protein